MATMTANWRHNRTVRKLAAIAAGSALLLVAPAAASAEGSFEATGSMATARTAAMAAPLPGGDVLVAGGWHYLAPQDHDGAGLDSAEIYDVASGEFTATGTMTTSRTGAAIAPLADGRVLIAGGLQGPQASKPYASAEIFDPQTGEFTTTGSMAVGRWAPVAAPLPDGRVLVIGGGNVGYDPATETHPASFASAEIYDPATGSFSATGSMSVARVGAGAAALADGRVLVAGGRGLASAELYDPASGEFVATGSLTAATSGPAVALEDGSALVFGGSAARIERYDPATASFSPLAIAPPARSSAAIAPLPGGRVLLAGGRAGGGYAGISAAADVLVTDQSAVGSPQVPKAPPASDAPSPGPAASAPAGAAAAVTAAAQPARKATAPRGRRPCRRSGTAGKRRSGRQAGAGCRRAASPGHGPASRRSAA